MTKRRSTTPYDFNSQIPPDGVQTRVRTRSFDMGTSLERIFSAVAIWEVTSDSVAPSCRRWVRCRCVAISRSPS